jgi:hypothetical protein
VHADRAAGRDLLVAAGVDVDHRGFVLDLREAADDLRPKAAHHLVLLERGKPDQHDCAVAKHHAVAGRPDPERQRSGRNDVAALEAGGVDPFRQQQDAGRHPCGCGAMMLRDGRIGHARPYAKAQFVPMTVGGSTGPPLVRLGFRGFAGGTRFSVPRASRAWPGCSSTSGSPTRGSSTIGGGPAERFPSNACFAGRSAMLAIGLPSASIVWLMFPRAAGCSSSAFRGHSAWRRLRRQLRVTLGRFHVRFEIVKHRLALESAHQTLRAPRWQLPHAPHLPRAPAWARRTKRAGLFRGGSIHADADGSEITAFRQLNSLRVIASASMASVVLFRGPFGRPAGCRTGSAGTTRRAVSVFPRARTRILLGKTARCSTRLNIFRLTIRPHMDARETFRPPHLPLSSTIK